MSNATKKPAEPTTVKVVDPAKAPPGKLQHIGGSKSDDWNNFLTNQTLSTLWLASKDEARNRQYSATLAALIGIAPQGEIEGMIAAQLVACHNASMECYRRAMLGEQTFLGRRENLSQANKLSRTYATLLEALNRHRGKGAQKVTVEHVHVHEGAQAIVGNVESRGGRVCTENRGSTPCSCTCARHHDAEHGRDAGACVNRRQCRTVAAGCTAEVRRALRWEMKTPSSTDFTRRKQSPAVDLSPS
jgi:hypothetical protein